LVSKLLVIFILEARGLWLHFKKKRIKSYMLHPTTHGSSLVILSTWWLQWIQNDFWGCENLQL